MHCTEKRSVVAEANPRASTRRRLVSSISLATTRLHQVDRSTEGRSDKLRPQLWLSSSAHVQRSSHPSCRPPRERCGAITAAPLLLSLRYSSCSQYMPSLALTDAKMTSSRGGPSPLPGDECSGAHALRRLTALEIKVLDVSYLYESVRHGTLLSVAPFLFSAIKLAEEPQQLEELATETEQGACSLTMHLTLAEPAHGPLRAQLSRLPPLMCRLRSSHSPPARPARPTRFSLLPNNLSRPRIALRASQLKKSPRCSSPLPSRPNSPLS